MNTADISKPKKLQPLLSLLSLIFLFLICVAIGQTVAWMFLSALYKYPMADIRNFTLHPSQYAHGRMALLLFQAIGTILFGFILSVLVWQKLIEKERFAAFFHTEKQNTASLMGLAVAITLFSGPFNSIFITLNKNMKLPAFLEDLETQMKAMEDNVGEMIKYMTDFQTPAEIGMALLVMGALTGIGEELFFRGAIQHKLVKWFKSPHLAIWLASAIFSFFHFQFYGFIPRMLLAALFGYMYYWSGNLWIPIIAHAFNNSFTVLALHFTKSSPEAQKMIESDENMPIPAIIISVLLTIYLLYLFKKKADEVAIDETSS